jgi:hypothetical protein
MITADDKRSTLLTLYPLFKEEVYRRRHDMMRWTAIGAGSLVILLLVVLLVPTAHRLPPADRGLLCSGIVLFTTTIVLLILQQRHRHRQAKRTLIDLERALGLFETDFLPDRRPLYPEHWQTEWQQDRSANLSMALLGLLMSLTISAVVFVS